MKKLQIVIGWMIALAVATTSWTRKLGEKRDERGISQSTENAILLAGAVAIAGIVIAAITAYVKSRMPQ